MTDRKASSIGLGDIIASLPEMVGAMMMPGVDRTDSPPEARGWTKLSDRISNLDREIPDGLSETLQSGGCFCDYTAWNFHANVWWEDGRFHAYVRQYRKHVATVSDPTLKELMTDCSEQFGYD